MRLAASEPGGRPVWPSAIGHAPLILLWGAMWAVSTQPARLLAGAMRHACARHAWTFVDNVGNVPTIFFLVLNVGAGAVLPILTATLQF